jgi:hypothetical protein
MFVFELAASFSINELVSETTSENSANGTNKAAKNVLRIFLSFTIS